MTPLDILPLEVKTLVMVLAATALVTVISMTAGQMVLEVACCRGQGKTQGMESE